VLVDFEPEPLPVSLVYPETRRTVQRLRRLVDFLTKELRKVL
jgi:DNA-binding transcriptional LysR family regulator